MYWRIKKLAPDQLARQYGIHAVLIVSVIFNLFALTRMNASRAMTGESKVNYERFCKQVTTHLFDANYLTFEDSMKQLLQELGPSVQREQQKIEFLPRSVEEMKAIGREMKEKQSVSCVRVAKCEVGQTDSRGLLPVDMNVEVVRHSVEGADGPHVFQLKYLIGINKNTHEPIVAALGISQEAQAPPGQQQQ